MNKTQGVELEIRKDDGSTIMVVQKQGSTRFSAGQRVVLASNGSQVTVSPLIKNGCGQWPHHLQYTSLIRIFLQNIFTTQIFNPQYVYCLRAKYLLHYLFA